MTNIIHTPDSQQYPELSQFQVLSIITSIIKRSYTLGKSTNPVSARALATTLSHEVIDILRKKDIDVQLHGSEQDMSQVGLYLGNHQAFGLEAFFANSFIAPDTRIVLKDDLLRVPITGKAMNSVDPIVFQRPPKNLDRKETVLANLRSLQSINVEQQDTLKQ
jgi:1-acyl-sn-glycerol-3-phosphate acyltransferase